MGGVLAALVVVGVVVLGVNLGLKDTLPTTQHAIVLTTPTSAASAASTLLHPPPLATGRAPCIATAAIFAWPAVLSGTSLPLPLPPSASLPLPLGLPLVVNAPWATTAPPTLVARLCFSLPFDVPHALGSALALARAVVPFDDRYETPVYTYVDAGRAADAGPTLTALRAYLDDSEFEVKSYWTIATPSSLVGSAAWLAANADPCSAPLSMPAVVIGPASLAVGARADGGEGDKHPVFVCGSYVDATAVAWPGLGASSAVVAWLDAGLEHARASGTNATSGCLPTGAFVALAAPPGGLVLGVVGSGSFAACAAELSPHLNATAATLDGIVRPSAAPFLAGFTLFGLGADAYVAASAVFGGTATPTAAGLADVAGQACALTADAYARHTFDVAFPTSTLPLCLALTWTAVAIDDGLGFVDAATLIHMAPDGAEWVPAAMTRASLFSPPRPESWTTAQWGRLAHDSITISAALLLVLALIIAFWQCTLAHRRMAAADAARRDAGDSERLIAHTVIPSTQ